MILRRRQPNWTPKSKPSLRVRGEGVIALVASNLDLRNPLRELLPSTEAGVKSSMAVSNEQQVPFSNEREQQRLALRSLATAVVASESLEFVNSNAKDLAKHSLSEDGQILIEQLPELDHSRIQLEVEDIAQHLAVDPKREVLDEALLKRLWDVGGQPYLLAAKIHKLSQDDRLRYQIVEGRIQDITVYLSRQKSAALRKMQEPRSKEFLKGLLADESLIISTNNRLSPKVQEIVKDLANVDAAKKQVSEVFSKLLST